MQGRWASPGSHLRAKLGRLPSPTVQVLLDSKRMGPRVGQVDLKESVGAWEKHPGPQNGLHLGHRLREKDQNPVSLAGVQQSKTYMLPRETPGLARAGKRIQGLRPQESSSFFGGSHTGRA